MRPDASLPPIAIIGCGAITESFHLPALQRHQEVARSIVFVDPAEDRARALASSVGSTRWATDHREILGEVGGAVVATPHHFHHAITVDCLEAGVPVLCEKPLAESAAQAAEIAEMSERLGVAVLVNQSRRLFPSFRRVREIIAAGELGELREIEMSMGEPFDWPSASGFYFSRSAPAKGVLLDTGAHIVDLACWWLGARPVLTEYRDDSLGGKEAVARLDFEHERCRGSIHLSWLSKLANRYRVRGERAELEGEMYEWRRVTRVSGGRRSEERLRGAPARIEDFGELLIDNFLDVVAGRAEPIVSAAEVAASISVIAECYERRTRFEMPWLAEGGCR